MGPNKFKVCMDSEKFGKTEWTETYTEEGICFDMTHLPTGAKYKESWTRKTFESGQWFEICKTENLEAYKKAAGEC